MSERYLSAILRENTGYSYIEYIDMLRMTEAQRLLTEADATVSQVASMTGYELKNTFYKAFKRHTGMSPTAYRNARKRCLSK